MSDTPDEYIDFDGSIGEPKILVPPTPEQIEQARARLVDTGFDRNDAEQEAIRLQQEMQQ